MSVMSSSLPTVQSSPASTSSPPDNNTSSEWMSSSAPHQLQQLQQPLQQQISVMRQQPYSPAASVSQPRLPQVSLVHQQHFSQQGYSPQPQQAQPLQQQPQQQRILGTAYTPEQREALEEIFSVWDTFTKQQEREETFALSKKIGLTTIQIRGWIQNRKKRGQYKGKQVLAPEQVRILEWVFVNHSNYPSVKLKQKLACELGLKYSRIRTWFQSRRQRGVPAVLTRIPQENDSEWNETVQKLRSIIEAVKVEDAFFLRFPFKGAEGDAPGAAPESPSLEGASFKSRAGPVQISDGVISPSSSRASVASSKMVSSPPLLKDSRNLPLTSFSPPASLPSRPASLNFPPEAAFPLNLLNNSQSCEMKGDPQKRKLNYMWKGSLESSLAESPKRRRMTQIPSKGANSPSFIPACPQQMPSTTSPSPQQVPSLSLPSWRENLARLSLEGGPSSSRSPASCNETQPLPRLHFPPQFSPEECVSPKHTASAFVSSDPGVTSSWTASDRNNDGGSNSPSGNDEATKPLAQDTNTSRSTMVRTTDSSMPLLPSIRELERAADRSSFSIPPMQ